MPTTAELNIKDIAAQTAHGKVTGTVGNNLAAWETKPWTLGQLAGVVAVTSTSVTLLASHEGCLVTLNNASAQTLTVPQDSTLTWPIGGRVRLMRLGTGQITVVAGSGATVRFANSFDNFRAQYSVCELIKIAANTWVFAGDTSAS